MSIDNHSYTKIELPGDSDQDSENFVMVCDDCGAQSEINKTEVIHFDTCILGCSKKWAQFYKEAAEEEASNLAIDPHYYDPYVDEGDTDGR